MRGGVWRWRRDDDVRGEEVRVTSVTGRGSCMPGSSKVMGKKELRAKTKTTKIISDECRRKGWRGQGKKEVENS